MSLAHHELCFGCGRTNLFGVMLELDPAPPDGAAGRCFIKQDHQGAGRGSAHEGVVAAALSEAMALVCGPQARARTLEVEFEEPAAIGAFLEVEARVLAREGSTVRASATATTEGRTAGRARGTYHIAPG